MVSRVFARRTFPLVQRAGARALSSAEDDAVLLERSGCGLWATLMLNQVRPRDQQPGDGIMTLKVHRATSPSLLRL